MPGIVIDPPATVYGGSGDQAAPPGVPGTSARPAPPGVPGTSARPAPPATPAPPAAHPDETTGSLTGLILSRGRTEGGAGSRTRLVVIGLLILAMIAVLAVVGLLAVRAVIDAIIG